MSDSTEQPGSWWDIEALAWRDRDGISLADARDAVIERWLFNGGDPRPYIDWVLNARHVPSSRVMRAIAFMMLKADNPALPPETREQIPFGLAIDRAGSGRPHDMEADVYKFIAGREASNLMDGNMKGRDGADVMTRDWLEECGVGVSVPTVEAARKAYRRDRGK